MTIVSDSFRNPFRLSRPVPQLQPLFADKFVQITAYPGLHADPFDCM